MQTLWQQLGKTTEPIFNSEYLFPLSQGNCEVCVQFPDPDGPVQIEFYWSADVVFGQKSVDPLVPNDPDMLICTSFKVKAIYNYDLSGNETKMIVTPEREEAFLTWIKDYQLINVDEWDI